MIIKRYSINSKKVNSDIKISIFSDLHYSSLFKKKRFKEMLEVLRRDKPNYICVPGDIIDDVEVLDSREICQEILAFFKQLGSIAPVLVSLGNHDITRSVNKANLEEYNKFWNREFKKLSKYNVFLLNNEVYDTKWGRFISCNPPLPYYSNIKKEEVPSILIKTFNEKIRKFDNNKLNILLCHSPISILSEEVIKNIKLLRNIDIVLSGHMHNGMVPKVLDGIFPKNRGFVSPNKKLYPDNARGIKRVEVGNKEITLLISGGITKISKSAIKVLHFGDHIYRPQMEYLIIKKV